MYSGGLAARLPDEMDEEGTGMEVKIGKEYIPDLLKRLKRDHITHGELCREIEMDPPQFSKIVNRKQPKGPLVETIIRIESGVTRILQRRERAKAKVARNMQQGG